MQEPGSHAGVSPDDATIAEPTPASAGAEHALAGDLGDRFRVISLLGRGGMGEVYAAEDLTLGRRVALKAIRPERRLAPEARERFLREARLLSRLDHPGICRIYDLVESADRDFLVLELISGRTLRDLADGLDNKQRLSIALQIAAVLEAAHAEGIVHRDLKPDNVMLTADGQVKVLDFGLARDLAGGPEADASTALAAGTFNPDQTIDLKASISDGVAVLGTPAYLSPEQARGEGATPASDMYAFGLVLQRLYTGQRAYEDSDDLAVMLAQARDARTRPITGIDRDLARLITRLEDRSAAARPNAVEARHRLAWIQRKPVRRARRWAAAAAIALILAAGGKYMLDLRHERQIAERHRTEAEGLVEFMIGDLRERLEPVGRLDVLDTVADRALAYFAARSVEDRTDADHHRFARTMNQIGEVRLNQGDLNAAAEAFVQARRSAAALVDQDPRQGEWLLTLGASEFWLGNVAYSEGDLDGAERAFLAYRAVAERLVALNAKNEAWQRELGYAHTNLAALHEARGQLAMAMTALDQSIRIKRLLLEAAPEDAGRRSDLINSLAWQGNVMLADGNLKTAHARYAAAVAETETLIVNDPDDMGHRDLLSSLQHLQAIALGRLGEDDRAQELFTASIRIAEQLVAHDPSNATWRQSLTVSHYSIGLHMAQGEQFEEAFGHFTRAAALAAELLNPEPDNVDYLVNLANAQRGLAMVWEARDDMPAARDHVARALAAARRSHDRGGERATIETLANCLVLSGEIDRRAGRAAPANAAWREAYDLLEPSAESSRASSVRDVWMRVLTYQGQRDRAGRVAADLQATGYARRDFERFRKEHELVALAGTSAK